MFCTYDDMIVLVHVMIGCLYELIPFSFKQQWFLAMDNWGGEGCTSYVPSFCTPLIWRFKRPKYGMVAFVVGCCQTRLALFLFFLLSLFVWVRNCSGLPWSCQHHWRIRMCYVQRFPSLTPNVVAIEATHVPRTSDSLLGILYLWVYVVGLILILHDVVIKLIICSFPPILLIICGRMHKYNYWPYIFWEG